MLEQQKLLLKGFIMANEYINAGQFSLGPNNSISIFQVGTNAEVDWGLFTEINWETSPVTERKPVNLMRGIKIDLVFDQGWRGEFSVQRTNSNLDVYWSALEAQIRAGVARPVFNIIQRIRETDGTKTQLTFINSQITYDQAGTWANEEGVVQKLTFTSPAREVKKV